MPLAINYDQESLLLKQSSFQVNNLEINKQTKPPPKRILEVTHEAFTKHFTSNTLTDDTKQTQEISGQRFFLHLTGNEALVYSSFPLPVSDSNLVPKVFLEVG